MKHTTRILALLLALVLCLGLSVTAFATEGNSITVKNTVEGQTYKLYKMLDLSVSDDQTAYSYTVNTKWNAFFTGDGKGLQYVEINDGFVTWKKDAKIEDFAKDAEAFAKDLTALQTYNATENGDHVFDGIAAGYYLVTSTLGTKATVGTTPGTPNPAIQEKNQAPSNEKKVEEDSTNKYGGQNDADIGQTVNFQSTITAQAGAQNYVFHDKMSEGLTFDATSVKVKKGEAEVEAAGNYTLITSELTDKCTFEVKFEQTFCDKLNPGDTIVISYSATLNASAEIGTTGNTNKSHITYGENGTATPESQTTTRTWEVKVFKYAMKENQEIGLENAVFELKKSEDANAEAIKLVKTGEANTYRVAVKSDTRPVTEITTPADGKFTIQGLDSDTYYLVEKQAPAGYNELKKPVKIVIGDDGTVKVNEETAPVDKVKVENNTGTILPSTGGMGTTIFYVLGGILAVGAAVLLVTKKRMERG